MKKLVATLISWGPTGLFALALMDGMGLPVPGGVDALIVFLASRKPDSQVLLSVLATIASTIGTLVMFLVARKGGEAYLERHSLSKGAALFRKWFQHYGLLTVFISALVPLPVMPMKIFVLSSGALGVSTRAFVITMLGGRIPRYFALAYLGAAMGDHALEYVRSHALQLSLFAAVLFVVLFGLVKIADYRRARRIARAA